MAEMDVMEMEVVAPEVTRTTETTALAVRYAERAQAALQMAEGFAVVDEATYVEAGALRIECDRHRKLADAVLGTVTDGIYREWKRLRGLFAPPVDIWTNAAALYSRKRLVFERAKQAEADRLLAEQQRLAREEQARLDRLAEEKAKRAEAKGYLERAQEIRETTPQVSIPVESKEPVTPKVKGIAKTTYWFAKTTDLAALVTAVAAGEVPLDAVTANESWLKKTANALKKNMKYPGVHVWSEDHEKGTGR